LTTCSGSIGELIARYRIGWSAGLTLRRKGGLGIALGSRRWAAMMPAATSWAAASMSRSRSNIRVMRVLPLLLLDVIAASPAMVENWASSTVATDEAIVSGSAPGIFAWTWITGKSTLGSSLTGRPR
jgi:hypothetical protein